jgi:hypothetical protein
MTASMPALNSNWPSNKPEGPAPTMATWVRVVHMGVSPEIVQSNAGKLKRWGYFSRMVVTKFVRLKVILCDDRAK